MIGDETPMPADPQPSEKPHFSVGAGNLASFLWKKPAENSGWQYEFNLIRVATHGQVSQLFTPADLLHVIKLVQVLGLTLSDDPDLSPPERRKLARLVASLDQPLRQLIQDSTGEVTPTEACPASRYCPAHPKKGKHP